jgi:hypothetical protein
MKILRRSVLMTILVFFVSARADVSRQPIKLADLPAVVRRTVMQQKGSANTRRLEKTVQEGNQIYELELRSAFVRKTVLSALEEKFLEVKKPTMLSEVSPAARTVNESSVGDRKSVV